MHGGARRGGGPTHCGHRATRTAPATADIHRRFAARQGEQGFELALVPAGACEPRWFMAGQPLYPEETLPMHEDLRARRSQGIHCGTVELTDESLDSRRVRWRAHTGPVA